MDTSLGYVDKILKDFFENFLIKGFFPRNTSTVKTFLIKLQISKPLLLELKFKVHFFLENSEIVF